jgi:hypothetical protein
MKQFFCWFLHGHIWPSQWEFKFNRFTLYPEAFKTCEKCGYKTEKAHDIYEIAGWKQILIFSVLFSLPYLVYLILKTFAI